MAGEMSLSKPFLKETKTTSLFPILPYSPPVQIVAQCSDWTEGPVRLEGSIQLGGARAVIPLGPHCLDPLWPADSWEKAGRRVQGHLDQSDWCLIFLFCQACISLLRLPDPRSKRKTVLKVKCFKEASLIGSK